ncbi:MAG: Smr/MutS family protein [Bacteroidota bacterium]
MLFSVGTRVEFIHTHDRGVVTSLLSNGMVHVLLEDEGIEIPAFIEDLARAEEKADEHPSIKAKIVPGKKAHQISPPEVPPAETQYAIIKSKGLQIGFDPILNRAGLAEKYKMYLINDTKHEALFTLTLKLDGRAVNRYNGKINSVSIYEVGELLFDQLNEAPTFEVECWRVTTAGTEGRQHRSLKIKPKQFFKKLAVAPLLNKQVHLFKVFESLKVDAEQKKDKEDLQTYTKRNSRPLTSISWNDLNTRFTPDVMEFAEFISELDLHVESLVKNHQKLTTKEILNTQLFHFEQYISKAIRLGVERVFIIHGVGKGKLRNEIATRLMQNESVKTFKNEFHPRYGYGATEVVFE